MKHKKAQLNTFRKSKGGKSPPPQKQALAGACKEHGSNIQMCPNHKLPNAEKRHPWPPQDEFTGVNPPQAPKGGVQVRGRGLPRIESASELPTVVSSAGVWVHIEKITGLDFWKLEANLHF